MAWLIVPVLSLAKSGCLHFTLHEMGRVRLCPFVAEGHIGWAGLDSVQHLSTTAEITSLRSQKPHFHSGLSGDAETNLQKQLFPRKLAPAGAPPLRRTFYRMTFDCDKCLQFPRMIQP